MAFGIMQQRNQRFSGTLPTCAAVVLVMYALVSNFAPTVGAQNNDQPALTANEKREAQQLSMMFTSRLGEALDFRLVVDELFVSDAAKRYVEEEKRRATRFNTSAVTLAPGIFVDASLLKKAEPEDWLRLYAASNNFLVLGLIYASRRNVNFDKLQTTDLYPAAVIELVGANPVLRNFIEKKTQVGRLKSAADMRSAANTLEQANAIMRKSLPSPIDLEETTMQMAMRDSGRRLPLTQEELQTARDRLMEPRLEIPDSDYFGFPKSTRMIWVSTFALLDLLLVRVDGKLRIVWAQPIDD